MSQSGDERALRTMWEPLLGTIDQSLIRLVHAKTGITWGGFFITKHELSTNGSFELTLYTTNPHTERITINAKNPWQPLT